jgi:MFS family permease
MNRTSSELQYKMESEKKSSSPLEGDAELASNETLALDPALEKRVLRKLDLRLAPLFATLYFVSYLDRSNIGNAAVAGLEDDLHLSESQYSTAVSVFFATYVTFEVPMVLAMKKFRPHRTIAMMVLSWSIVTIGTAFVKSYGHLIAVRVLLGLTEAGFFPCLTTYIAMVYKRHEQVSDQAPESLQ